jgi:hypothetical protein
VRRKNAIALREKLQQHTTTFRKIKVKFLYNKNLNVKISQSFQEKSQALESSLLSELEQLERSPDKQRRQSLKSICVKSAAAG